MNVITIQTAKEEFVTQYPLKDIALEIEVLDPDKLYPRIEGIFEKKGKDMYALMSLNEQGGANSATTLIYKEEAYIFIRNVPKINEIYLTGAVYTEMARIYSTCSCGIKRNEIFQFTFNEHCLIGYGFWIEYGTKLISYTLLSQRFPKIKSICMDSGYIDSNFARMPNVYMNQLTGYSVLADLFAVLMLRYKEGVKENICFPVDRTFVTGSRLNQHFENILEILIYQDQKEDPFNISDKVLTRLGTEVRKFDDALAEYRGTIGA